MDYPLSLSITDGGHHIPAFTACEQEDAWRALRTVQEGEPRFSQSLGWHCCDQWAGDGALEQYEALALQIRSDADVYVVVGVGGSNQAARAVISALSSDGPDIIWAGNTIASYSIEKILQSLEKYQNIYIHVIAKNFETLEPGITFRILRRYLQRRYPDNWNKHIFATGSPNSQLEVLCAGHRFGFLPFPPDIGGRYTALSPVGLLPMAVAGIDIRELARGASQMENALKMDRSMENPALRYAMTRYALYRKGFRIEMQASFEPRFYRFSKWWAQLFGESEGKEKRGLYPVIGSFSEDLHSVGQFLQEGTPIIFETFLSFRNAGHRTCLTPDGVDDRFGYLDAYDLDAVNEAAFRATIAAHSQVFPCIDINVDGINPYTFGQLFYFFEFACYLSGTLMGINPFDQPGVEAYKKRMFEILGK